MTANAKEPAMNKATSICFGRFIIDLPEGTQIREMGQQSEFMFGPVKSEHTGIDINEFSVQMKKREVELNAGKHKDGFKLTEILSPSIDSKIFKLSQTYDFRPNDPPSPGLEAYHLSNGTVFSMGATGFNDKFPQIVDQLKSTILPSIRTRQPDEIPTDPGFCIKNGFIANDGSDRVFEEARLDFNFKNWPDLWLTIYSRTVAKEGQKTLLQRIDSTPIPAIFASVVHQLKTLRKGKHPVGNFPGEDSLDIIPTEEGAKVHSFTWEAQGMLNDPFNPTLHLDFSTGHVPGSSSARTRPSLTDEQAMKLFDSIVNSIRLRPTGPAKVNIAEPPPLPPLGTTAFTGSICPQSGLWYCDESIDYSYIKIEGGRKQFFQVGQAMPQAVLLGKPSFWQKHFGGKKSFRHSTTTSWKLDAYDDATVQSLVVAQADLDKTSEV
jgi:hypothetical protein